MGLLVATETGSGGTFSIAGVTGTITFSDAVLDGDLLFAFFASAAGPTVAWSTPSGWTLAGTQKNGSASIGGRAALFYKIWHTGDSKAVTSSGPSGNISTLGVMVRSDGATLVHGNPPASGYSGTYDAETTVAALSATMPKMNVADTLNDLRVYFVVTSANSLASMAPAAVTPNANNPFGAPARVAARQANITISGGIAFGTTSDSAGIEAGTQTWTMTAVPGKFYVVGVVVHDPAETGDGGAFADEHDIDRLDFDIEAVGLEHLVTDVLAGGGGAITVF